MDITAIITGVIGLAAGAVSGYFGLRQRQSTTIETWQQQMIEETHALRQECRMLREELAVKDGHITQLQQQIGLLQHDIAMLRGELALFRRESDGSAV